MPTFPLEDFIARFPEFADTTKYTRVVVQNAGIRAMMHITPDSEGMPLRGFYRNYALFLMTAHIISLDNADSGTDGIGNAGIEFKASVGTVSVERSKPNTFTSDNWDYWLQQTQYGRELLAYLDTAAPAGIFLNTSRDTVRDLV